MNAFDPDELDGLLPAVAPAATRHPLDDVDAGDEPPVVLADGYPMQVWSGAWKTYKKDHRGRIAHPLEVDRSGHLWNIGALLYEAGATRRTIAAALAERDRSLDFLGCYLDRPAEYDRIAGKVMRSPRGLTPSSSAPPVSDTGAVGPPAAASAGAGEPLAPAPAARDCADLELAYRFRLEQKDAKIAELEAKLAAATQCTRCEEAERQRDHAWKRCNEAERRLRALSHVQSNQELSPGLRSTVQALAKHLDGADWDSKGPRDGGWKHISRNQLAATAGVSPGTVSGHLRLLKSIGVIEKHSPKGRSETSADGYATEMLIRNKAGGDAVALLEAVARYRPPEDQADRQPGEKKRGSAAPRRCPNGCAAELVPQTYACPDCGEVFEADDPRLQDADEDVKSQNATSDAEPEAPSPAVDVRDLGSRNATSLRTRLQSAVRGVESKNGTPPDRTPLRPRIEVGPTSRCPDCQQLYYNVPVGDGFKVGICYTCAPWLLEPEPEEAPV